MVGLRYCLSHPTLFSFQFYPSDCAENVGFELLKKILFQKTSPICGENRVLSSVENIPTHIAF
jgi:hypothetical protein